MRQEYALGAAAVVTTVVVTLLVIQWPDVAGLGALIAAALTVFAVIKGWWRQALVVTILAMAAIVGTEPKPPKEKAKRLGKFYSPEPGTGRIRAVR